MTTPLLSACLLIVSALLPVGIVQAGQQDGLSVQRMTELVHEVTLAQNKATTRGATLEDVERLYAMYTADFIYEHPGMDDVYTRELLFRNHTRALERGVYDDYDPAEYGYRIVETMAGDGAVAVHRSQARLGDAPPRMAVFEFRDGKVARIREYWNY
ncbi:hypothetical protein H0E84_04815 [Luteimonas sp. SJ-92]|uniref:Nuclear transport factor 2 family protein n=1 Tax=Luteimonas salinisoli TaxID=2752307 RepID=A0A853J923_9GAMM|nr:hypothetical protein [Luteimonas salinisoli]NZA25696.1 hypothetical protein [Luteimonas salinisoli]